MRLIGVISTAVLSLILAVPAYAQEQHDQQEEQKAKPEEKKAQPEKSAKPQEEKKAQPEKSAKPEEKSSQQQNKNNQQEEKNAQEQNKNNTKQEEKNAQQQNKNSQQEQKNAQQQQQRSQEANPGKQEQHASGNGGGRIPDDRYKAHFGREHSFHVSQGDYGNRRFEYGGYTFAFVGAWPSNWLYSQDVFVIEIDGVYYLCNPMYPGVNIALDVTL